MTSRPTAGHRREFGSFLSSRRARLQPAAFGLPDGPRRTPGLRREEVAVLAGVSVSWYTWLEQGRDIQPSAEALRRISKVLKLDRIESGHLYALCGLEMPAAAPVGGISPGLEMLVRAINPIPAYVRNGQLDILAWNDAIAELFVDYGSLQPRERNTLRLLFLYIPYRTLILDWEQMARGMIHTFRAVRASPGQGAVRPSDRRAVAAEPGIPRLVAGYRGQRFDEGSKRLKHPTSGHSDFTYVALTPEGRPDLSLVTYIPRHVASDPQS